MPLQSVSSYAHGQWIPADDSARQIESAITGEVIGIAGNANLDTTLMLDYARSKGGAALRAMGFHDHQGAVTQLPS